MKYKILRFILCAVLLLCGMLLGKILEFYYTETFYNARILLLTFIPACLVIIWGIVDIEGVMFSEKNGWISVKKLLPDALKEDDLEMYLTWDGQDYAVCFYEDNNTWDDPSYGFRNNITHWRKLPNKPR